MDWLAAIEGTPDGRTLALGLALFAAVAHAVFGALQKGRHDPWLTRGAIDVCYSAMALPVALLLVPWPEGRAWAILAGAMAIHLVYKLCQAMAYTRGAFTVVYPIVRGSSPLVTVAARLAFAEHYSLVQWLGVLLLSGAILGALGLQRRERRHRAAAARGRDRLGAGHRHLRRAYTTYDAFGIRATPNPFTFLAWFFLLDGLDLSLDRAGALPARWPTRRRSGRSSGAGIVGGLVAYMSFGAILMATRIDKVGQAAVLRETSVVFAALIGWAFLGERVGRCAPVS